MPILLSCTFLLYLSKAQLNILNIHSFCALNCFSVKQSYQCKSWGNQLKIYELVCKPMSIILQHFPSSSMEEEKLKKQKQEIPTAQIHWKRLKQFSLHLFMSEGSSQAEDGLLQIVFNLYKQKSRMKVSAMDLPAPGRESKAVPQPGLSWKVQHGTVAAPPLDPMGMLSKDNHKTSSTETSRAQNMA